MSKRLRAYFDIHAPVFYPASLIILFFIGLTLVIGKPMEAVFARLSQEMTSKTGWLFVFGVNFFVVFSLYLALGKFGRIRLGGAEARPDFSLFAWFAMLFSAGMGIGLLFFSVAEPVMHFSNPPLPVSSPNEAVRNAFKFTFLHYGLHAWAIYAVVGLALAFFTFNKHLPLTIRSVFYPLLGDRIYGWPGHITDIVAVVATLFGLATSLGFGVQQVSAGLSHLFGTPDTIGVQVILIVVITLGATASVVLGLDKGVRVLSEFNMRLGLFFLVMMLVIGPTVFLLDGFIQNTGAYLQDMIRLGTWTEAYTGTDWQNNWTVFYWAWWISWSPFVGMFIARVSRGRTIREFVLGVLIVPSLLTFLWMTVFGGSALSLVMDGATVISEAVNQNIATALFVMLEQYPLAEFMSVLGIVLVMSFFVTSSDSGSLVIDSITSGGKLDAPVGQRIFWALSEGAVAGTLLLGGGLAALQTAAVTTGLPFAIILFVMCFSLYKGLQEEWDKLNRLPRKKIRPRQRKMV
ncbi:MAG: BCCT family transporter [Saprospiraceae bacterium]|jgi:choline/glycine/proline betaine transport protein|nr:BCCT family transporter [Saprospiraceae bacterium]MDP4820210.1 BCCT family transporter [Saprospiraceae bacterium]MDP4998895.1 BCCT family transporter [Saprospiraceae bacterium]